MAFEDAQLLAKVPSDTNGSNVALIPAVCIKFAGTRLKHPEFSIITTLFVPK